MGADSNGARKTTLVMAPLWALTGSRDPRPDSARGLPSAEVVHQAAKRARIRVDGTINGKPFTVERATGRKASLKFIYDEEDLTCQEIRMTQFRIELIISKAAWSGRHIGGVRQRIQGGAEQVYGDGSVDGCQGAKCQGASL